MSGWKERLARVSLKEWWIRSKIMESGQFRVAQMPSGRYCVLTVRPGLFPGDEAEYVIVSNRPLTRAVAVELANGLGSVPRERWTDEAKELVGPRKRKPRGPATEGTQTRRRRTA